MKRYRLRVSLRAIKIDQDGKSYFAMVAAGSVVHLQGSSVFRGLVEVVSNGEHLNVFREDLEIRSDPLSDLAPE